MLREEERQLMSLPTTGEELVQWCLAPSTDISDAGELRHWLVYHAPQFAKHIVISRYNDPTLFEVRFNLYLCDHLLVDISKDLLIVFMLACVYAGTYHDVDCDIKIN